MTPDQQELSHLRNIVGLLAKKAGGELFVSNLDVAEMAGWTIYVYQEDFGRGLRIVVKSPHATIAGEVVEGAEAEEGEPGVHSRRPRAILPGSVVGGDLRGD